MGATGFTTGDPNKVDITGDTMTGSLTLSGSATNLTVGGSTTTRYAGITTDITEAVSTAMSTGTVRGGNMDVNPGNPQAIDISALVGYVVDHYTDPANPTLVRVTVPSQTVVLSNLTRVITWWLVTSAGAILQQAARPTAQQRRTHIVLGATAYDPGSATIFVDQSLPVILSQPANQLVDLFDALTPFSVTGNVVTPNGANLQLNRTAGTVFANAFNFFPSGQSNPHVSATAAQTPASFRRLTQVAQFPAPPVVTTVDPAQWDNGGVLTPVTGNDATIQRLWIFPANAAADQLVVQYGQRLYASLQDAKDGVGQGDYVSNPTTVQNAALIGYILVKGSATALNDTNQAIIRVSGKFDRP